MPAAFDPVLDLGPHARPRAQLEVEAGVVGAPHRRAVDLHRADAARRRGGTPASRASQRQERRCRGRAGACREPPAGASEDRGSWTSPEYSGSRALTLRRVVTRLPLVRRAAHRRKEAAVTRTSASTAPGACRRPSTSRSRATPPARPRRRSSRPASRRWPRSGSTSPSSSAGGRSHRRRDRQGRDAARPRARPRRLAQGRARSTSRQAIEAAAAARPRVVRAGPGRTARPCFLKAAELLATTWRATLNAATMLGQSKTAFQAEIDSACELVDFWRFNPHYAQELYAEQPLSSALDVEPARLPAARGLRLRGHALQLHGHRRQPAHRPRPHGQHRGVEAGLRPRSRAPTAS